MEICVCCCPPAPHTKRLSYRTALCWSLFANGAHSCLMSHPAGQAQLRVRTQPAHRARLLRSLAYYRASTRLHFLTLNLPFFNAFNLPPVNPDKGTPPFSAALAATKPPGGDAPPGWQHGRLLARGGPGQRLPPALRPSPLRSAGAGLPRAGPGRAGGAAGRKPHPGPARPRWLRGAALSWGRPRASAVPRPWAAPPRCCCCCCSAPRRDRYGAGGRPRDGSGTAPLGGERPGAAGSLRGAGTPRVRGATPACAAPRGCPGVPVAAGGSGGTAGPRCWGAGRRGGGCGASPCPVPPPARGAPAAPRSPARPSRVPGPRAVPTVGSPSPARRRGALPREPPARPLLPSGLRPAGSARGRGLCEPAARRGCSSE